MYLHLAGLAVFLVVLTLISVQSLAPWPDQMGMQTEIDASCGTCNGLLQPLDLEESFFQGLLLSRGRTAALFMVAISTVNSCLMITACHTSSPPPTSASSRNSFAFSCFLFLCKAKGVSLWSPQQGSILLWQEHGAPAASQCAWWTSFCMCISSCQQWSWFYLHIKRKRGASTQLPSLLAKGSDLVASLSVLYHSGLLLQMLCYREVFHSLGQLPPGCVTKEKNFINTLVPYTVS